MEPIQSATSSPISSAASVPGERLGQRMIPRTSSIDSAISSLSSTSQPHKSSFDATALSQADIGNLIATAGSPEAVIIHLLKEKHHAASQNGQLWRLVDKQRTLILGLNKDLERALKEKDRYKKRYKELQSSVPPSSSRSEQQLQHKAMVDGDTFMKQGTSQPGGSQYQSFPPQTPDSDQREQSSSSTIRSQTVVLGNNTDKTSKDFCAYREDELDQGLDSQNHPPLIYSRQELATASPSSLGSSSSPGDDVVPVRDKQQRVPHPVRKPPPAPLNLGQGQRTLHNHPEVYDSESEYEDILAVDEFPVERGRRKTRDDDDREREANLVRERTAQGAAEGAASQSQPSRISWADLHAKSNPPIEQQSESLASLISPRLAHSASLSSQPGSMPPKSPGLPVSPRPEDRPPNSPLPRLPRDFSNSIASSMGPGSNVAGLTPASHVHIHQGAFDVPTDIASQSISSIDAAVRAKQPQPSLPTATNSIYQGLVSEDYPNLLLPPNALPLVFIKVSSSRLRPSRNSYLAPRPSDEEPVFTLGVFSRSERLELWRVEKVIAALPQLDQQVKQLSGFCAKLPDRSVFGGHSPAKVDARRDALDIYFEALLDTPMEEKAALVICQFLTSDAIEPRDDETSLLKSHLQTGPESSRGPYGMPRKEGYLTKRGKNFGGWKARYFVLHGPELKYFESPGGPHLGTIKIYSAQIGKQSQSVNDRANSPPRADEDSDNQYRHAFLILEPKKKDSSALVRHVLCAESDEDRDSWVDALLEYVEGHSENESPRSESSRNQTQASRKQHANPTIKTRMQSNGNDKTGKLADHPGVERADAVQGFSYEDAIPAEPPVIGPPYEQQGLNSPSIPRVPAAELADAAQVTSQLSDPGQLPTRMISGPTNGVVIQDAGAWGNKSATSTKEKKRSIWGFRTRSSVDLASQLQAAYDPPSTQAHANPQGDKKELVRPVFGIPLAEAVQFCAPQGINVNLPAVVYRCIEYLKAKGAESEEGIFRLSGSNIVVKALKERFNTESDVDFLAGDQYYDVHAVASLFKQYLRELPTTVLTRELHIEFLRVLELNDKQNKIAAFNSLVHRLPKPNMALLQALVRFLIIVVNNSDVNKMTVRNVGIVFAPTLNIPAPVFSMFLTDFEGIFDNPPGPEEMLGEHPASPNDAHAPQCQPSTEAPTPAHNQTTFRKEGNSCDNNTNLSFEQSSNRFLDGFNLDQANSPALNRMLTPNFEASRFAKSKRRESSLLFMEVNHQPSITPTHDDDDDDEA
ncbi:hypothetical protein BDV25DRAFT_166698 [Aspergillus avenaceus]|uniref:RhoGAP-domain-containing protein n=1 Tax=Aspergillus avenaceus TaxID=36643 RepID=A0A5N6TDP3_ASPAV|nr:hypothetical protein BDV25DRAFT_166698 [Aspergillus avenaceus]